MKRKLAALTLAASIIVAPLVVAAPAQAHGLAGCNPPYYTTQHYTKRICFLWTNWCEVLPDQHRCVRTRIT